MTNKWIHIDDEIPKEGEQIWVLFYHWKMQYPCSFSIEAGEVEFSNEDPPTWRVNTCDYTGHGSYCHYPKSHQIGWVDDYFEYWCTADEIDVPEKVKG